jgi:hypothetical protein
MGWWNARLGHLSLAWLSVTRTFSAIFLQPQQRLKEHHGSRGDAMSVEDGELEDDFESDYEDSSLEESEEEDF